MKLVKKILFQLVRFFCLITASFRTTPNFLIIGVQKGGTTSLFHYLKQHPQIKLPRNKEIHFFDRHYKKGLRWYKSWFPFAFSKNFITGEATPSYIYEPGAAQRIKENLPAIKLIVLLRNPVDRAYSHYQMEYRKQRESFSDFDQAIEKEITFLQNNRTDYQNMETSYLTRGLYALQLEKYYQLFPKENILLIKSEEFRNSTVAVLKEITAFLKVKNFSGWKLDEKNVAHYNATISAGTRKKLEELFTYYNQKLSIIF